MELHAELVYLDIHVEVVGEVEEEVRIQEAQHDACVDDQVRKVFPQERNVRILLCEMLNIRLLRLPILDVLAELEEP